MAPIKVGEWDFQNGSWTKGVYRVTRRGKKLAAWMPWGGRFIQIGTASDGDVSGFLAKIDRYANLKEVVYA